MNRSQGIKPLTRAFLIAPIALLLSSCFYFATTPELDDDLPAATQSAPAGYAPLLSKYVKPSGVDYKRWHQNPADLQQLAAVTRFYATTSAPDDEKTSLAWHLNAYNSWILQRILVDYPNKGPSHSLLFFVEGDITVSGKNICFETFEQKIIRPQFDEPRIHFALNCASRSCPPLHNQPFEAGTLSETLEALTTSFINTDPEALTVEGKKVQLSKIFDWYQEDFGGRDQLIPFINRYRETPLALDSKISFKEYNWDLNQSS